jgi:hypothetical protein
VTEIPEHLLKRSRERRSNLDLDKKADAMAEPIKTEQEVIAGRHNFEIKVRKPVHSRRWYWEVWTDNRFFGSSRVWNEAVDWGTAWTRNRAIKKAARSVRYEKKKQENRNTPWEKIPV